MTSIGFSILRSIHGSNLSSDFVGNVYSTFNKGDWEEWKLVKTGDIEDSYYIYSSHERYLTVTSDNRFQTTSTNGTREKWILTRPLPDNSAVINLKNCSTGLYIGARPDRVLYLSGHTSRWELWTIESSSDARASPAGASPFGVSRQGANIKCFIRGGANDKHLGTRPDGSIYVIAANEIWETWTFEPAGDGKYFICGAHNLNLGVTFTRSVTFTYNIIELLKETPKLQTIIKKEDWEKWSLEVSKADIGVYICGFTGVSNLGSSNEDVVYVKENKLAWEKWTLIPTYYQPEAILQVRSNNSFAFVPDTASTDTNPLSWLGKDIARFYILGSHNRYLSIDPAGSILSSVCNDSWETWNIYPSERPEYYYICGPHGKNLSVNGDGSLLATVTKTDKEQWRLKPSDTSPNSYLFLSHMNSTLTMSVGGKVELKTGGGDVSVEVSEWEKWKLEPVLEYGLVYISDPLRRFLCTNTNLTSVSLVKERKQCAQWILQPGTDLKFFIRSLSGKYLAMGSDGSLCLADIPDNNTKWKMDDLSRLGVSKIVGPHDDKSLCIRTPDDVLCSRVDGATSWKVELHTECYFRDHQNRSLGTRPDNGNIYVKPNSGAWRKWTLEPAGEGKYFICGPHGKNLGVTFAGGIFSSSTVPMLQTHVNKQAWEKWTLELENNGGGVYVCGFTPGSNLGAKDNGEVYLSTNRDVWEKWNLQPTYYQTDPFIEISLEGDDSTCRSSIELRLWSGWEGRSLPGIEEVYFSYLLSDLIYKENPAKSFFDDYNERFYMFNWSNFHVASSATSVEVGEFTSITNNGFVVSEATGKPQSDRKGNKYIIVAFRGSVDRYDWVANLQSEPNVDGAHKGMQDRVHAKLLKYMLKKFLQGAKVIFAGHSQGGGIALLTAFAFIREVKQIEHKEKMNLTSRLEADLSCVTFAAPFMGMKSWVGAINNDKVLVDRFLNFVNEGDPCPVATSLFCGYLPAGNYVVCRQTSKKVNLMHHDHKSLLTNIGVSSISLLVSAMRGMVTTYHSLDTYFSNILKYCEIKDAVAEEMMSIIQATRTTNAISLPSGTKDVNSIRNMKGDTLLHIAVYKGYVNVITLLLSIGADISIKNEFGHSVVYIACSNNLTDICRLLLTSSPPSPNLVKLSVDACDQSTGLTSLHNACKSGHLALVELLVYAGANVNLMDKEGNTPLAVSIQHRQDACRDYLKKHGGTA